jgi:hypothetical protein
MNRAIREAKVRAAPPALTEGQFKAMEPREQRRAIARDVLVQISSRRVVPSHGRWVSGARGASVSVRREDLIDERAPQCHACALGSLLVSAVRLGNQCDRPSYRFSMIEDLMAVLAPFFPADQTKAIEFCFELGRGAVSEIRLWEWSTTDVLWFRNFAKSYQTKEARLQAICQRVVDTGEFLPDAGGAP